MTDFSALLRQIKEDLTPKQIVAIVQELGGGGHPQKDSLGNYIFPTICHNKEAEGSSKKLYYYDNTKLFKCYTQCDDVFDIYELIIRNFGLRGQEININGAYEFLLNFSETQNLVKNSRELYINRPVILDDWNFIEKYKNLPKSAIEKANVDTRIYPEEYLEKFVLHEPLKDWVAEGIDPDVLEQFEINYNLLDGQITIPYRNSQGQLIGVRARNCDPEKIAAGLKYHIAKVNGEFCTFSSSFNLYGIYQNQEAIKNFQKAIIFEGEKSVLKCNTLYRNDSFAVAVGGSNITKYQRNLLLELGVSEVILAFDKEYTEIPSQQYSKSCKKLRELALKFAPYCKVSILIDKNNWLYYKDSPIDQGKRTLEHLLSQKIVVEPI